MHINNNTSNRKNTNIINNNVSMSDLVVVKKNKMKNSKKRNTNTNTIKTTSSTYCSSVDADEEGYEGLVEYNYKSSINNNNNYNYNYNCNRNYNSNNNNNVSYLNNNSIRSSENNKNNDNNELRRIIPSLIGWSNKIKTKQILKKSYILLGELELKSIEIGRLNFFSSFVLLYYYNYNYYNIFYISTTDFDDK